MSRKALVLFISATVIWGSSFLCIRVAVRDISPAALVFGRTVLGAVVLVPLALRTGAFRGIKPKIPAVVAMTMLNMCAPIFLTAWAEQHIASSATGILIATDPLFTAILALRMIRTEAAGRSQLAGLLLGFAGVIALLGLDFSNRTEALLGAAAVLLSAVGYAASALLYQRWLADTPPLGVSALMIINTGVLSWMYFALVREAGAAVTSLITYVVPVVALVLGVSLLGENLTIGVVIGLTLIALGTWLSTSARHPRLDPRRAVGAGTEVPVTEVR